jgi:hypothetical protein
VLRRSLVALGAALAAACALSASAGADGARAQSCGWSGYSYAGLEGSTAVHGVAATVSAQTRPEVMSGHVAAWVGVGGSGLGPNGTDEWIQVGLASFDDGRNELYYEVTLPGKDSQYFRVADATRGRNYRVAVRELASRPGTWRVWLDGRAVSAPVFLPGSHGSWSPVLTSESWDGGKPACNRFDYRFTALAAATAPGGAWQPLPSAQVLQDPGYAVSRQPDGFVARAVA